MPTLSAWMMAQERDRYAREAMHRSDVLYSFFTRAAGTRTRSLGLGEWTQSLRRRVRASAAPASACCAA